MTDVLVQVVQRLLTGGMHLPEVPLHDHLVEPVDRRYEIPVLFVDLRYADAHVIVPLELDHVSPPHGCRVCLPKLLWQKNDSRSTS